MAPTDNAYSARVTAAGTATIEIRPFASQVWTVTQVSTEYRTAPTGATSGLRKNGNQITVLIATGDVADGVPSTILRPGDVMTVNWAGCTPGDTVKAFAYYDDGVSA
jgi:hypothetical protein